MDCYPSTFDVLPIAGGQDAVLVTLIAARDRYAAGSTAMDYVNHTVVCAVGAVIAVDTGITDGKELNTRQHDMIANGELANGDMTLFFDSLLSDTAKEAMHLLDKVSVELFLSSEHYGAWYGPLEWLNQSWPNSDEGVAWRRAHADHPELFADKSEARRYAVLKVYDKTIEERQASQPVGVGA